MCLILPLQVCRHFLKNKSPTTLTFRKCSLFFFAVTRSILIRETKFRYFPSSFDSYIFIYPPLNSFFILVKFSPPSRGGVGVTARIYIPVYTFTGHWYSLLTITSNTRYISTIRGGGLTHHPPLCIKIIRICFFCLLALIKNSCSIEFDSQRKLAKEKILAKGWTPIPTLRACSNRSLNPLFEHDW